MTRKNIKISEKHHDALKRYCDTTGYKMSRYIELMIEKNCGFASTKKVLPVK